MDRNSIALAVQRLDSKADLLDLLNRMKWEDMAMVGMLDKYYPFTMKHINYYCNPNNQFHRYKQFSIKKKTGGERLITSPRNNSFKLLLRYINELFKAIYTPSKSANGFAEGRSVVTNASIHKGQNYVFNIDLQDFFSSIDQARVWKRLQLKPLGFNSSVANVLAGLCSMKVKQEDGIVKYVLPQGAPTSPIITNMICDNLDRRLTGLANRFGINYSRYADDITFSSMHNVYQVNGDFRIELERIIEGQGFKINTSKTRLQKRGSRQEVTGIIVNEKLNVTQKYVREIRNILYVWERYGYAPAYDKFASKYKYENGCVKKGIPDMVQVLRGRLMYMMMVKGSSDKTFIRLMMRFIELLCSLKEKSKTTSHGITYISTLPILEFEEKQKTKINIITTRPPMEDGALEGLETCEKYKESFISRRYATFKLGGITHRASVNKHIKPKDEDNKNELSISHCRDVKGKLFWLIHKSDKVTVSTIDINELINELDSLLNI